MSNISPAWTVTKAATPKTVQATGSKIVYNANSVARATMVFNNTDDALNNFFADEDEVEVKIGAQLMLVGFIDDIIDKRLNSAEKELQLEITDFAGYLAAKTAFERDFKRSTLPDTILETMAAELPGVTTNVTDLDTVGDKIKRNFIGTYVKDGWNTVALNAGGDYFTDENKVFQAFLEGTRELEESVGNTWKITDQTPATANELNPDYNFPIQYHQSAKDRYRSVIVTNNIKETYPNVVDLYQTEKYKDDTNGKTYSSYYRVLSFNEWTIDDTPNIPFVFFPTRDVGGSGQIMPTVQLRILDGSTNINFIRLIGLEFGADGVTREITEIGLDPLDWQFVAVYIQNSLVLAIPSTITIKLRLTDTTSTDFWQRDIFDSSDLPNSDINGSSFTFLEYDLPANLVDSPSNGWTKTGSPTTVNSVEFIISPVNGYTAASFAEFGKFHFFRRRRASSTGAGSPVTEKVIIDSTAKSQNALQVLADKEQIRANKISKIGFFKINGNTAFRHPAFLIDTDFVSSLGTGRSGLVRMDQIIHNLTNGIHKTRIEFKPSNTQP